MDERQPTTMAHPGRNIARKFLSLLSKRKRDEEKKRMDLRKAMRDSSVERLAAVIASARMEFGDQLNDLCSDAEGVLRRLLREGRPSGTHRKVTLRERLLLADIEASGYREAGPETSGSERNNCSTSEISSETPPMLQAVLTLMRPSAEIQAEGVSGSMSQQTVPGGNSVPPNTSGRRLLSALLWEERTLDDPDQGWVAFGVSVGAPIHFDHSRSQSARGSELSRAGCHRPSASLGAEPPEPSSSTTAAPAAAAAAAAAATTTVQGSVNVSSAGATSISTVPETPMRVSLMSLLREAEEGSGIIFMNRQMIASPSGLAHDSSSPPTKEDAELMCCVCMGRHKGAAFIPCGHTFCRKCSRELQQARGTCPLCNKEIKDILNLY